MQEKRKSLFLRIKGYFQDRARLWVYHQAQSKILVRTSKLYPEEWAFLALSEWEKKRKELEEELRKIKKRRFLSQVRIEVNGERFRVKYYSYRHRFFHLLENLAYQSEGMRNFNTLLYLVDKEVLVPKPLVLVEPCLGRIALESVLILQDLEPAYSYREMLEMLGDQPEELWNFLVQLMGSLARFHLARVYNRDTDKNLLIKKREDKYQFYYFDFDNVFFWRAVSQRRVAQTLRHLLHNRRLKLTPEQIQALVSIYLEQANKTRWRKSLLKKI